MFNDELTAASWALNAAVECNPHTFPRSNTFNNLINEATGNCQIPDNTW